MSVTILKINALIFMYYSILRAHCIKQAPFTREYQSGTHLSVDLFESMRNKCLAHGLKITLQPGFKPSITISRNRHLTHVTSMPSIRLHITP